MRARNVFEVARGQCGIFVNPAMVKLAREARGLTQQELARGARITQGLVSKIESGELVTSVLALDGIARAVNMPHEFFFQTDDVLGESVSETYHYGRSAQSSEVPEADDAVGQPTNSPT